MVDRDWQVRSRAFEFLDELRSLHGDVLPYRLLHRGFEFEGIRVPLLGPKGIFKPRVLPDVPLTITTAPPKPGKPPPYDDELGDDGFIRYRYRGTDWQHRDNVGLRRAYQRRIPLVYLYGIVPGRYIAEYPTFIVGDDVKSLTFLAQVDQRAVAAPFVSGVDEGLQARREYITVSAKHRLHQASFRVRVLAAYRRCCAMCRLRHEELLDAAHIVPDSSKGGHPVVPNGLALCKLHHAAFDRSLVAVRPDLVIEVAERILREKDGPMLRHGLQGLHGTGLLRPARSAEWPAPELLEVRYRQFLEAS